MMVDFILQAFVTYVDIGIVGRLNSESVAAIGFCTPITWLMFALFKGYNQSVNALVARYIGAGNRQKAENTAFQSLLFSTYISVAISLILLFITGPVLRLFSIHESVRDLMFSYLIVVSAGLIFVFYTYTLMGIFQGMGHTRTQLFVSALMNILNMCLSYYFIIGDQFMEIIPVRGLGLGVRGAAWSLVISRIVATMIMAALLGSGRYPVKLSWRTLKSHMEVIRPLSRIGFPVGLMEGAVGVMFIIVNELAARTDIGTNAISALAIGQRTEWFAYMPMLGLMGGVAVMVGQNIGAGKLDRAVQSIRSGCWIAFIYLTFWSVMYLTFPEQLVRIFTNRNEIISPSMMYITIFAIPVISYFTLPIHSSLRAAGDTTVPMIINLIAMFVVRIPLAYYLAFHTSLDYEGLWWGMIIGMVFENLLIFLRYKQGVWKSISL
jgi:putative MATE family efflux protein